MQIQILAEDENLLAVLKPSGIHSAPTQPQKEEAPATDDLCSQVLMLRPEIKAVQGFAPQEGGLLHRLDHGTSGVILFAKNQQTFAEARQAWSEQKISKIYLAWVQGDFHISHGITYGDDIQVRLLLGHDEKSKKRMRAVSTKDRRGIRGAPQETHTSISLRNVSPDGQHSLLALALHTGVMHQIRAVLSAMSHPIIGDEIYGSRRVAPESFFEIDPISPEVKQNILGAYPPNPENSASGPSPGQLPKGCFFLHALGLKLLSDEFSRLSLIKNYVTAPIPSYYY